MFTSCHKRMHQTYLYALHIFPYNKRNHILSDSFLGSVFSHFLNLLGLMGEEPLSWLANTEEPPRREQNVKCGVYCWDGIIQARNLLFANSNPNPLKNLNKLPTLFGLWTWCEATSSHYFFHLGWILMLYGRNIMCLTFGVLLIVCSMLLHNIHLIIIVKIPQSPDLLICLTLQVLSRVW